MDGVTTNNNFLGEIPTNPLDQFDNVTYNIKLYLIPPDEDIGSAPLEDINPKSDQGGQTAPRGGFLNGAFVAKPENTVVLAQTGVTGTLIDNLVITQVPSGKGFSLAKELSCTIKQPGAANFFDMIVLARRRLGIKDRLPSGEASSPFFFEINFQGYRESGDGFESDDGGQVRHIAGPYRYRCLLKDANFSLDSTGTTYDLSFAVTNDVAFSDRNFKTESTITTTGSTITEMITSFKDSYNALKKLNSGKTTDLPDLIEFNLHNLVKEGQDIIKDETLVNEQQIDAHVNTLLDDSGETRSEIVEKAKVVEGSTNIKTEKIKIEVPAGTSIDKFIGMVLNRNKDFMNGIVRSKEKNAQGTNTTEREKTKTTNVNWYKINGLVKQTKFDETRGGYAKEIIYIPTVYKTPTEAQIADPKELNIEEDEIKARIQAMDIKRAYEYIFTGRNDQILSVDWKYNFGFNLLIPPHGGRFGNAVLNEIANFSTEPQRSDDGSLSGKDLASLGSILQDAKKLLNLFKAAKEGSIRDLAKAAGLDDAKIKEVISERTGKAATALVDALSNKQIGQAVANAILPKGSSNSAGSFTESDRQIQLDNSIGETYDPEPSGYIYGNDLLSGIGLDIDIEPFLSDADVKTAEDAGIDLNSLKPNVVETMVESETSSSGPPSYSNTLFGYMYGQKDTADIMFNLDMTLRGDPWYLGEADRKGYVSFDNIPDAKTSKSTEEGLDDFGSDNFILFELRQPQHFDPFISNEDLNTGMYPPGKQSYMVTGVYRILEVENSFDNGRFTVNARCAKEFTLDLSKIKDVDSLRVSDLHDTAVEAQRLRDAKAIDLTESGDRSSYTPDFIQGALDTSNNLGLGSTAESLRDNGLISSEQYDAWKDKYGGG